MILRGNNSEGKYQGIWIGRGEDSGSNFIVNCILGKLVSKFIFYIKHD